LNVEQSSTTSETDLSWVSSVVCINRWIDWILDAHSHLIPEGQGFPGLLVDQLCLLSGADVLPVVFQKCQRNSGGRCLYNSFVWDLVQSIMYISTHTVGLGADDLHGESWQLVADVYDTVMVWHFVRDSHKIMTQLIVMLASEYGCRVFSAASWICLAQAWCLYLDQ